MFQHHSYFTSEQIAIFRRYIANNRQNIKLITSRLMLAMGFKMQLRGATYLCEAINYYYRLPDGTKVSFSKNIYPLIAKQHNTKPHNVDRDIRTAIKSCYESNKMFVFNELCGCEIISPQYQPTNSELIVNIALWINSFELENNSTSYQR